MNAVPEALVLHAGQRKNLLSSASQKWSGFGADIFGIGAGMHRVPAMSRHRVAVHVGKPVNAVCRCDGKQAARLQSHGDTDVVPAGFDGEWSDDANCTILTLWFDTDFVRKTYDQLGLSDAASQIRPRVQWRDARFQRMAWAMLAELEANEASDPPDALYAESLATAMLVRLAGADSPEGRRRRTLSARAATRVVDYIETHLDARLSLDELAGLADLSTAHFKVLFRETFGKPVHRYVVERRLERARTLLLQGRLSVSQVALEVGFAHQSHLASWMKRMLGVTPRDIAREASVWRRQA